MRERSLPCVGGRFRVWVVGFRRGRSLVLVGSLLRVGSCPVIQLGRWFGINVLTVFQNNDERRIKIRRSSFGCHVTDSDVATCSTSSVYFTCMLELSRRSEARVGARGVCRWMARAGNGGRRVWMMVVTWKVVSLGFGQNSHSRKLPISFLGRRLHGWYLGHKISMYIKAFVV